MPIHNNEFEYKICEAAPRGERTISILKYIGNSTDVIIPNHIDGLKVRRINQYAFRDAPKVRSVTVPQNVRRINSKAFYNCRSLKFITINGDELAVGTEAFANSVNLDRISFKEDAKVRFDRYAFRYSSIKQIHLPQKALGDINTFADSNIQKITISENPVFWCIKDDALYYKGTDTIITYPTTSYKTVYKTPETLEFLNLNAFSNTNINTLHAETVKGIEGKIIHPANFLKSLKHIYVSDNLKYFDIRPQYIENATIHAPKECTAINDWADKWSFPKERICHGSTLATFLENATDKEEHSL